MEGTVGDASLPGTMMQLQPATAFLNGRPTWVAANLGTSGLLALNAILLADDLQGFTTSTAYVAGTRGRLYVPVQGEEMNVLCGVGGPTQTFTIGDYLMVNSNSGVFVAYSGNAQSKPYQVQETITGTSPFLVWVMATGM